MSAVNVESLKQHLEAFIVSAKEKLESDIPVLAADAEKAEASPIMKALEGTYLPGDVETMIAGIIQGLAAHFPAPAPASPEPAVPVGVDAETEPAAA